MPGSSRSSFFCLHPSSQVRARYRVQSSKFRVQSLRNLFTPYSRAAALEVVGCRWDAGGLGNAKALKPPPCENLGRRLSPRVKHFGQPAPSAYECQGASAGCLSPKVGEPAASAYECNARMQAVSEMYRGRLSMPLRIFAGCPSFGSLSSGKQEREQDI